ncbi:MAG: FtsW/RodA/SpoVE family cell cycle protein [Bacteroidaceae bacterium]|nr:FtsW/RodA/SpoVE family cell cycle protein [Bacteroidaceae bacterium]MEE0119338.1 FtsW/RodA/SpoVE family cell cycle protein [Bacteroidaceae bacterium]
MNNWSKKNFKENGLMQGDMVLWMVFLSLCFISIITVYSASSNMTYTSGKYWAPVMRHGSFILLGIGFTWVMHMLPCKLYKLLGLCITLFSYILLICALFAGKVNGASRWVGIGEITFQPSEIAKLGLVMATAFVLSVFRDKDGVSSFGFKLAAINIGCTLLLIVTENLSTAAIIFVVMYLICFYAQVSSKILSWLGGSLIGLALAGYLTAVNIPQSTLDEWAKSDGIMHRVPTWVNRLKSKNDLPPNPKDYDITKNVQVTHAQIAIATCGITGRGPGNSIERDFLPQAFSDFIYAIIIEEFGIFGGGLVMFLYLLLLYRALRIAQRCKSLFPAYLIMGLALMLVMQAMVNMAVAVGVFPVTGQPLPLISRGGTSTFVNCAYLGIMLSVSRSARKSEENETQDNCNNKAEIIPVEA